MGFDVYFENARFAHRAKRSAAQRGAARRRNTKSKQPPRTANKANNANKITKNKRTSN